MPGGLRQIVNQIFLERMAIAYRAPQTYLSATGAYTIFNVNAGAIIVHALIGRATAAATGAVTVATTFNGVAGEAAPVACNGAVGLIIWVPLNVAGTLTNIGAQPLTDALFAPKGLVVGTQPAGPGLIVTTYAAGTSLVLEWSLVYQALTPNANVTVA
jgi:hypothetical protein